MEKNEKKKPTFSEEENIDKHKEGVSKEDVQNTEKKVFGFGRKQTGPNIVVKVRDPRIKTTYDVLMDNLKISGRKTFLHRIVYAGMHNFPITLIGFEAPNPITIFFRQVITQANNASFVFEKLTGYLVYYDRYFIHVVEGDEDAIQTHLQILYKPVHIKYFTNLKLFTLMNHINDRMTLEWSHYYGIPRKCLTTPDLTASMNDIAAILFTIIQKIFRMIIEVASQRAGSRPELLINPSEINKLEQGRGSFQSLQSVSSMRGRSSMLNLSSLQVKLNPLMGMLPEIEQLDFVLKCDFPPDLEVYKNSYGLFTEPQNYKDLIWPIPTDFVPYDVLDEPFSIAFSSFPKSENEEKNSTAATQEET